MELAMVGLGKMGANMTTRLLTAGHGVVVTDRNPEAVRVAAEGGAVAAESLQELVLELSAPRAVWVMVPSGAPTESVVQELSERLDAGDLVIDGGNSNYKETIRRGEQLKDKDIQFVDVGTSGGVWGRRCCRARSKSLTSLCRSLSHPAQYVSGIPSPVILLTISHPIRCSTRCLANVRVRISGPMIAL